MIEKFDYPWQALGFKTYQEYLESQLWKDKRDWIIKVKEAVCSRCGSTKRLNVHHISYDSCCNEKASDVMVLCWICHMREHNGND